MGIFDLNMAISPKRKNSSHVFTTTYALREVRHRFDDFCMVTGFTQKPLNCTYKCSIVIKAARERKKLKLAPASGADRTNHEEHSNKNVGAKKSSLEKSMPMLV